MDAHNAVLFSDLDGTLFDSNGKISKENLEAIDRFIDAGGLFAISTGRAPINALNYIDGVHTNCPSIVFNGAGIYDFNTAEYSYIKYLDRELVDPVFHWAYENIAGLDLQVYSKDEIIYLTPEETARRDFLDLHKPYVFSDFDSISGTELVKSLLYCPENEQKRLFSYLDEMAEGRYYGIPGAVFIGERLSYYEIMPLGISKGSALNLLRDDPVFKDRVFFAAGDYWNDYELIREADVPVVPANAIEELKAMARFVTASNNDSAIAHIIDEVIPGM